MLVLGLYVVDGFDMQILGVTVFALATEWRLPIAAFGAAMAAGHAGSAVGAALGGMLGDRFGRRPVAIAGTVLFGVLTIATVLATTPAAVFTLRFVAGLGLGGCLPPALALLTECLPPRRSGAAVSFALICPPLGVTLAGLLAGTAVPALGWRGMFVIGGAVPLAMAAILLWLLPESPAFVAGDDRRVDSMPRPSLATLLSGPRGRQAGSLFGTFFAAYFAMSMVMSWLPALLAQRGFATLVAGTALSAWSLSGIAGSILAGLLIVRFGSTRVARAYLLLALLALCAIAALLPEASGVARGRVALLYGLMMTGGCLLSGSIASIYAYGSTLFAPAVRASGIGIAATSGRIGAIVGAYCGAMALAAGGERPYFLWVAAIITLALVVFGAGQQPRDAARPPAGPATTE